MLEIGLRNTTWLGVLGRVREMSGNFTQTVPIEWSACMMLLLAAAAAVYDSWRLVSSEYMYSIVAVRAGGC